MIQFLPLGGADEIGASCFYLNIDGTGIILDCGIHPRKNGFEALPDFEQLNNLPLDFVFISHAHQDHIGSLPFLVKRFPHVIIYTTKQTREVAEITLNNAVNIFKQNENLPGDFKFYTHEEIELLVRSIRDANYKDEIFLRGMRHPSNEPIKIIFYDSGHIIGSTGIFIEYDNHKIFYTGDINLSQQSIMNGADIKGINNIDTLILETTYGSTDSGKIGSWKTEEIRLAREANKILHGGGSILIPVFALGKTQEILSTLFHLIESGKLTDTILYTGGISKNISKIYDNSRFVVKRNNPDFELSAINQIDLYDINDLNEFRKNPGIVLASSGMMIEGTTSYKFANFWMTQKDFAIFGVGYMDEETPGYKIINSSRGDKIKIGEYAEPQTLNCSVHKFYFPSHSKREDLLKIVDITNPKRIILVHGENESKNWVGYNILKKYNHMKIHSAENGKVISL